MYGTTTADVIRIERSRKCVDGRGGHNRRSKESRKGEVISKAISLKGNNCSIFYFLNIFLTINFSIEKGVKI